MCGQSMFSLNNHDPQNGYGLVMNAMASFLDNHKLSLEKQRYMGDDRVDHLGYPRSPM